MRTFRNACAAILAAVMLSWAVTIAGCVGGGISGTAIVVGAISAFGSIVVNGIEFDTRRAVVTIGGDAAGFTDLELGMTVAVRGVVDRSRATGVADRVAVDHVLVGPVEGVNAAQSVFVALGQAVLVDDETVFADTTLDTLAPGELVEIFGVRDAEDAVRATRVQRLADAPELELMGVVADLDAAAQTFRIGMLTIDFSRARLENVPGNALADGMHVDVDAVEPPANDVLVATGVERVDPSALFADADEADIEGVVTTGLTGDEFVVNQAHRVRLTATTFFENGTRSDIVANTRVDVSGTLKSEGVILADEVEFLSPARHATTARVGYSD